MAFITLSGTLLDPNGDLAVGDQIRFTHKSTTGKTVEGAVSIITINPAGTYSLPLQYGLVLVEYKDVRTQQFKNLGVATVNSTNPATSIPELLNALVPVSSADLIEFQAILANAVAAQTAAENAATTAEAFAYQLTTTDLIASTATFTADTNIPTSGFTTSGDGGNGSWKQNGVTGQTPSQTPAQLGNALLNDASGNQWALLGNCAQIEVFGGKMDGVTDNTLVTNAVVNWGKKVIFSTGTYLTRSFFLLNKRIEIQGSGQDLTFIKMINNATQNVISMSGTGWLKASNLTIDQNFDNNTGGHGIRSGGCDGLIIDYVTIQNCSSYGIGLQAGTSKGVNLSNFTIKNTNSDGIDIKDYNFNNECIYISNYTAENISIVDDDDVALDIRGEVVVNGVSIKTVSPSRGIRTRLSTIQGRAGFGTVSNVSFKGHGTGSTIALQLGGQEGNVVFSNVTTKDCSQAVLQSNGSVGGIINNLSASGVYGDGMSINGSDLIINGFTAINTVGSSRVCDVESTAENFSLRNFHIDETTGSSQGVRVNTGASNTNFSDGTIRGGSIADQGTATVQSNVRIL